MNVFLHVVLLQTIYLIVARPFAVKRLMRLEFINEAISLTTTYFFLLLFRVSEQGIFVVNPENG